MSKLSQLAKWVLVLFFCLYTVQQMFRMTFPLLDHLINYMQLIFAAILFVQLSTNKKGIKRNKAFNGFILFFLIYSCYILIDLTYKRIYSFEDLMGCPGNIFVFFVNSGKIFLVMLAIPFFHVQRGYKSLYKWFVILSLSATIFNILSLGQEVLHNRDLRSDFGGGMSLLKMGYNASTCLFFAVALRNDWFANIRKSNVFSCIIGVISILILLIGGERGPMLWSIMSILVYFYMITHRKTKFIKYLIIVGFVLVLIGGALMSGMFGFTSHAVERIEATFYEADTSGRMNLEDGSGGYFLAIEQFLEKPWFGSYFRIISNNFYWGGAYPHNFFLEHLITMGLVGTLPVVFFLFLGYKKAKWRLLESENPVDDGSIFFLGLFLTNFFALMTSGTILLNMPYWIPFAFFLYDKQVNLKK